MVAVVFHDNYPDSAWKNLVEKMVWEGFQIDAPKSPFSEMSPFRVRGCVCQRLLQFPEELVTRRPGYAVVMLKNGRDVARNKSVISDPHRAGDRSF